MYNETVMDHFSNPRNVGIITDASGTGHASNSADGDKIIIYIKVEDDVLVNIKFNTYGCGAAIAASSMITTMAEGMTLADALGISNDDVAEALGGLPPQKLKCSNIAADALHDAIRDYRSKTAGRSL